MIITQLDVAIRAGAVATLLMLAWLLFASRRQVGLPARLFLPLSLCIAGFVIGNTPLRETVPDGVIGSVAHGASGFTVIFLWWFCLACFDSRFRVQGPVLAVGLAWVVVAALDRGILSDRFVGMGLSRLLVPIGFAIVGHLTWRLLAERREDLIERRQDARAMAVVLLGGMLFLDLSADVLFGFAWRSLPFAMMQNAMILAFALWLGRRLLGVRSDVLTFGAAASAANPSGATAPFPLRHSEELHRRLTRLMQVERIFLDPELTFSGFVERMGASERSVRALIHEDLGYDHFRTFLNQYRVKEARRLMDEGGGARKLITIALDSGFASLASFNRVFRTIEGRTPSDYRKAARQTGESVGAVDEAGF